MESAAPLTGGHGGPPLQPPRPRVTLNIHSHRGEPVPDAPAYPYETHLDILHAQLEKIDVQAISDSVRHPWWNQTLCKVNDSVVRLGVVQGEYHWHKHDVEDEFFYVVEGRFLIDLEG